MNRWPILPLTLAALAAALFALSPLGCGLSRADPDVASLLTPVAATPGDPGEPEPEATPSEAAPATVQQAPAPDRLAERERRLAEEQARLDAERARLAEEQARLEARARAARETERRLAQLERRLERVERAPEADAPVDVDDGRFDPGREENARPALPTFPSRHAEAAPARREPSPAVFELPAFTRLEASLLDPVSSRESVPGDAITARLVRDVRRDGVVLLPAGTDLLGAVAAVDRGRRVGGRARIELAFDEAVLPGGARLPLRASATVEGERRKGKDAATIGGATAGGALLGRLLSKRHKSKGTLLGAALGAAVGTAVAAEKGAEPLELPEGTMLAVTLDAPADVPVDELR